MGSNWQTISSRNKNIIIKLTSVIIATALFLTGIAPSFAAEDAPTIEGTSAILMDAKSGEILYEKNAYEKRDPASIAKIMTCLVVLETMELDEKVTSTIDFDDSTGGVGIEIKKGEVFTVEHLMAAVSMVGVDNI